ncbi:MAG: hypothetical protein D4S01_01230 [Dehalococcoidia bacterium]|nr:MAG: hypothetical protein D4S01_01230 [Dehalococcoidia bacterium]
MGSFAVSDISGRKNHLLNNAKAVFGTQEWAESNANFINGCTHDCKYCYSKAMAIRFGRKTSKDWKVEEIRKHSLQKRFKKTEGTIMFPSAHDICPDRLDASLEFLENILSPGNNVLIVTKPHYRCIQAICDKFSGFKDNILFRFTIGSSNSEVLKFWEPGAPDFEERLACLRFASYKEFQTSVSCEPMLDDNIGDVIQQVFPFVSDAIWIGKANSLLGRLKLNGETSNHTTKKAYELIEWQSNSNIMSLYCQFKDNPKIKWKESIKRIIGLEIPTKRGLDV